MPQFNVICKSARGETVRDMRSSPSRDGLLTELRRAGFVPISVEQLETKQPEGKSQPAAKQARAFFGGVKLQEVALGFRVLATMLGGGLPILDCLLDVAEQSDNPRFRETLLSVASEVRDGSSLSEAVGRQPNVFNPMACAMIKAGEESGTLTQVLERLSVNMEARLQLHRKLKAGTRYPMFIFGFFVLAVSGIFLFIIPKFQTIFESFGAKLPALTRITMAVSSTLASGLVYFVPGVIAAGVAFHLWKRTPSGTRLCHVLSLKVPLVGKLVQQIIIGRLARSLSLLIASGVSIVDGLRLTERIVGNVVVGDDLGEVRRKIVQGSSLSQELEAHPIFPSLLVRMAAAGEASGKLGDMLDRVADYYEKESSASIDGLLSLLEPALIVGLGITVCFVVLAVYFPIFNLAKAAG